MRLALLPPSLVVADKGIFCPSRAVVGGDDTIDRRGDVIDCNINCGGIGGLTVSVEAEISKAICTDIIAVGVISYFAIGGISDDSTVFGLGSQFDPIECNSCW